MRFIRVLFIVLTLPTMSFGQEKTIRYRIDYLMRQDAVTSLYKIEVVNKSDNTTSILYKLDRKSTRLNSSHRT